MSEAKSTPWARERFGDVAEDIAKAVARAVYQAHGRALAAHFSGGLASNDTYGVTLHVAQYEELVAECQELSGVSVRKPKDVLGRFDLVVRDEPPVVLYPWRYATDQSVPRDRAKLRPPVSDLRKSLLSLNANNLPGQLTLDQAAIDPEELEAQLAEEQALLDQMARLGHVVTVGYASNPGGGIFELGWGDVEILNEETGEVQWHYWEELPPPGDRAADGSPRKPVAPRGGNSSAQLGRFDDAPLENDLGLRPRPPVAEPPIAEPERVQVETGSDEPE